MWPINKASRGRLLAHIRARERKTKEDDDKVVIEEEDDDKVVIEEEDLNHYKPIN